MAINLSDREVFSWQVLIELISMNYLLIDHDIIYLIFSGRKNFSSTRLLFGRYFGNVSYNSQFSIIVIKSNFFYSIKYESPSMARIKNKTKIGYWDNDIVEKTVEAVHNIALTEPVHTYF